MLRQLDRALRETRTVELRLDWLSEDAEIERFLARLALRDAPRTLIATCRRRAAGGAIAAQLPRNSSISPKPSRGLHLVRPGSGNILGLPARTA